MAEAAIIAVASPILKLVIGKLGSGFWEELGLVWGVNSDIGRLQSVLSTISDVLDDAERRSIGDKALTGWLRKLKDAAFDADDVVDEFQYEALRRRNRRRNQLIGKDPMEATKANLATKTSVHSLKLQWNWSSDLYIAEVEEVFERLQPHFNLKKLYIWDYPGINLPTWMTRMEPASSPICNLVMIEVMFLERCECLPVLGHLPFLQEIDIWEMNAVRRIGVEFYGDGGIFPTLRSLRMRGLSDLEEWSTETMAAGKSMMAFPSLEEFALTGCPKLRVAPRVPPSVVDVCIEGDRLLSAVSIGGLYKLRSLTIQHREALSLFPRWEWMQDLTVLTNLYIVDDKLSCLPEGILQLRLPSLQTFNLQCRNMKSISGEEMDKQQQPPTFFMTIQVLRIQSCRELTALPEWLGSLTSLSSLCFEHCPKLEMLPDWRQCLTALRELKINYCSQLARRCERERGEDWPKIAHIPNIHISGR